MQHIKHTLLLGSKSPSRQSLLKGIKLPFTLVGQDADESVCDWGLTLPQVVESIALHKMKHVVLPQGKEGDICFVLTADTLSQDLNGRIEGKPVDRADAVQKIRDARAGARLATAFCLDKKIWKDGAWQIEKRIVRCEQAEYIFAIPEQWIDIYIDNSIALEAAHAIAIEEFGAQFLKVIHGSYSTIVGLPLFELREALEELDFFNL
ncbi:MAG: Maf family protein [Candidatus Dependentiae bacterium]|nr:Maf family protein [Candidatus Dependentiae bacterium]